jgi:hypothetical protein
LFRNTNDTMNDTTKDRGPYTFIIYILEMDKEQRSKNREHFFYPRNHTYFHSVGLPPSPEDVPGGSPREAERPLRGQTQLPRESSQAGWGRPRSEAARRVPEVRLFGVGCLRGRTGQAKAEIIWFYFN